MTYLNLKTCHGTETVDEISRCDYGTYREYRLEVRRLVGEYNMAGMAVYSSSRCCRDWKN